MQWLHLRRRKYSNSNPDSSTPILNLVPNLNPIPDPNGQWSYDSEPSVTNARVKHTRPLLSPTRVQLPHCCPVLDFALLFMRIVSTCNIMIPPPFYTMFITNQQNGECKMDMRTFDIILHEEIDRLSTNIVPRIGNGLMLLCQIWRLILQWVRIELCMELA